MQRVTYRKLSNLGAAKKNMSLIQLSKNRLAIFGQAVANALLLAGLYNEYTHNVFMQQYIANLWVTSGTMIITTVVLVSGGLVTLAYYFSKSPSNPVQIDPTIDTKLKLEPIDSCPVCNSPLRPLATNRVQCRNCKRYFKK